MQELAPTGQVYQAGTLSGNPRPQAGSPSSAAFATTLCTRSSSAAEPAWRPAAPHGRFARVGAMATLFAEDAERYAALFRHLLQQGVYVAPSQFEAMFVSLAHGDEEIERTVDAVAGFGG